LALRAWQTPQVSSSFAEARGALRRALPVAGSIVQCTPSRSSKCTVRPLAPCRFPFAQATCAEPGP